MENFVDRVVVLDSELELFELNNKLAMEAMKVKDPRRQCILAGNSFLVVRLALAKNPDLCPEAARRLGDLIPVVREETSCKIIEIVAA